MAKARLAGRLTVILHADIVDSTALVRQDEQLAHRRIQDCYQRLENCIRQYGGRSRERRGDAVLASFDRASDAVSAALAFQIEQQASNSHIHDDIRVQVRIGIALGEVVLADRTVTGAGVVLAQRLEQIAVPGAVVIQGAVYDAIPERFPFKYRDLGEHRFKGFDEQARCYRVSLQDGAVLPKPRKTLSIYALVAISAAVVIAVAAVLALRPWETMSFEPASLAKMRFELPDKPSIAVLAFDNLSGDPGLEYLSDGISENIITALSRFSQLVVISRQTTFSYKGKPVTVKQVSEELGVRYVLEGSVQVAGEQVRVTAQLINALEGSHAWAESYDRKLDDIFAVQDEISSAIAATLDSSINLTEFERVRNKPPKSLGAYESFVLASSHWFKYSKDDNDRARELFQRARDLDPGWAEPYRGLAWVYINAYRWGWNKDISRERSLELALENARKGVALEPNNHRLHQALAEALLQAGHLDEAIASYEQAIRLNPNDASVLASATSPLIFSGKSAQAIGQLQQAIRMNPYHPDWYLWNLGFAQYLVGDYEAAVESFFKMKNMPNLARRQLAASYVRLGKLDEARTVIDEFLKNEPGYNIAKLRHNFENKFTDPEPLERFIEDLRKAGLPE